MCSPSTEPSRTRVAQLDPATYRRHALHAGDRTWAETNCYTDVVIELVHAMGHEPLAMLPFTLAIDFEGDQWTFFKPPLADLETLYGIDVQELALWRPLADHVVEQVDAGRSVLVEVDSYYLPDTVGSAYRSAHVKTTVGVNAIDLPARRLGYFHNAGYFELEGEDFVQALLIDGAPHERVLPPYVEMVKWQEGEPLRGGALVEASVRCLRRQVARIPRANPFTRFKARFGRDLLALSQAPMETFHAYSFANLRQYGACFELAASCLQWLGAAGLHDARAPAAALDDISRSAKNLQFQLARAMSRHRPLDLAPVDVMGEQWQRAMDGLRRAFA